MSTEPKKHGWIWVSLFVVALLGGYVGAYLGMSQRIVSPDGTHHRKYQTWVPRRVFVPLGQAEAKLRGEPVALGTREGFGRALRRSGRTIYIDP